MKYYNIMIEKVTHRKPRAIIGKVVEPLVSIDRLSIMQDAVGNFVVTILPENALDFIYQTCEVVSDKHEEV